MTESSPVPRPWAVLAVVSAAQFLTILDLWVANIALPVLRDDFPPATLAETSWILDAYAIVVAALLIPAGRLADLAGRRRCFLAGLAVFGAASLGCALAPALPVLIGFRALQAAGAAVLMPTSLGLALAAFPAHRRGTAVGVWAAVGAVAAGGGPVLGGLLVSWDWRWIFLINVPLVIAAFVAAGSSLPHDGGAGAGRRVDVTGVVLELGAIGLVCVALTELPAWPPARTFAVFVAGSVLAVAFVVHIRRRPDPVVAPRLFTARAFRAGAAGIVAYYVGFAAILLGTTLLLTEAWRFTAVRAALGIAPGPLTAGALSPFAGALAARFGRPAMVVTGAALFAGAGAWLLAAPPAAPAYAEVVLPAMLLWGVANALIQPALFASAEAVPHADLASGAAVLSTARQLGSALGVAVLVAVLGTGPSVAPGLDRAWLIVLLSAVLTALAGAATRGRPARDAGQAGTRPGASRKPAADRAARR